MNLKHLVPQIPLLLISWLFACVLTYLVYFQDITLALIPLLFAGLVMLNFHKALKMAKPKSIILEVLGCYVICGWVLLMALANLGFMMSEVGMTIAIISSMLLIFYLNSFLFKYKLWNWGMLICIILGVIIIPLANALYSLSVLHSHFKYPFIIIALWQLFSAITIGVSIPPSSSQNKLS